MSEKILQQKTLTIYCKDTEPLYHSFFKGRMLTFEHDQKLYYFYDNNKH